MGFTDTKQPVATDTSSLSSDEKFDASKLEHASDPEQKKKYMQAGLNSEDADFLLDVSPEKDRAIFRKVDIRLVPMLALLYLIAHLDRANIGNAKIEGIEKTLHMKGTDYNVAVMIFFVPYILFEVPSNILLAKFKRPSVYMGCIVCLWGTVMTASGFVKGLSSLCVVRFLIGVFEAGFFPGAMWLISQWYPPSKTQFRMSLFYFSSAASGAFSGLLAAGITQMHGLGGLEGWRWIFIMEGIASVVVGASCFFLLPDTPALSGWLKPEEQKYITLVHRATRGIQGDSLAEPGEKKKFQWGILASIFLDPQIYLQMLVFMSNTVPNYALKFTMPQIIKNMGFTSTNAQLLTAPPYLLGAVSAMTVGFFADRTNKRMPFMMGCQALLILAYSVLFVKAAHIRTNIALCYVMVAFACIGVYPIVPGCTAWTVNNLAAAEKRSMGIAALTSLGNVGGIIGSFIFLESEKPTYPTGFGSSLSFGAAGFIASCTLGLLYTRHNRKYANVTEEEVKAKYTDVQLLRMGDKSPLFKYNL